MIKFVLYRSRAVNGPQEAELLDILRTSTKNNTREGITGFLHVRQGAFCQYVEGEEEVLRRRPRRIEADRRHRNFELLVEGKLTERLFPEWGMSALASRDIKLQPHANMRKDRPEELDVEVSPVLSVFDEHWQKMRELRFGRHSSASGLAVHVELMDYLRARLTHYTPPDEKEKRRKLRNYRRAG